MKKIIALVVGCLISAACVRAQIVTPNIGLQIPLVGQANWQVPLTYDLNLIDATFGKLGTTPVPYSIYGTNATGVFWVTPTANGQCLMSAPSSYATTTPSFQSCGGGGGGISGSGTTNYVPMFTGSTTIGNSDIIDAIPGSDVDFFSSSSPPVQISSAGNINAQGYGAFTGFISGSSYISASGFVNTSTGFQYQGGAVSGDCLVGNATGIGTGYYYVPGSCSGSGGGIGGSGTTNYIPLFTGSTTIGNSHLTDSSGTITSTENVVPSGSLTIGAQSTPWVSLYGNAIYITDAGTGIPWKIDAPGSGADLEIVDTAGAALLTFNSSSSISVLATHLYPAAGSTFDIGESGVPFRDVYAADVEVTGPIRAADYIQTAIGFKVNGLAPSGHCLIGNGVEYVDSASCGGGGSGVSSLNSLTGALSITAGSGISVTPSGSSIQITNTGGGVSGSGTSTKFACWSGTSTLGNCDMSDNGSALVPTLNIVPSGSLALGTQSAPWTSVYANAVYITDAGVGTPWTFDAPGTGAQLEVKDSSGIALQIWNASAGNTVFDLHLIPAAGNTFDIGTSGTPWNNLYADYYHVGSTLGASCSGLPTTSFASSYGIVTHC